MSTRYKFGDNHATYFVTFAVVDWVDVFTRNDYREIVISSINHCISNKGLLVHAWVIMSNHVHLLISLQNDNNIGFSDVMRDMKKYTAMQLIKNIRENPQESRKEWMLRLFQVAGKYNSNNTNFQFWRQDNHPLHIKDMNHYSNTLNYIHNNPVNSGWVEDPAAYIWSSARDYTDKKGCYLLRWYDFRKSKKTCTVLDTSEKHLRQFKPIRGNLFFPYICLLTTIHYER